MQITGKLGDVMQESARAALSWIRAQAELLKIDIDFFDQGGCRFQPVFVLLKQFLRAVIRTIVHHPEFEIPVGLFQNRFDGSGKPFGSVPSGDNDADLRHASF